jgi:hypothetical protein
LNNFTKKILYPLSGKTITSPTNILLSKTKLASPKIFSPWGFEKRWRPKKYFSFQKLVAFFSKPSTEKKFYSMVFILTFAKKFFIFNFSK